MTRFDILRQNQVVTLKNCNYVTRNHEKTPIKWALLTSKVFLGAGVGGATSNSSAGPVGAGGLARSRPAAPSPLIGRQRVQAPNPLISLARGHSIIDLGRPGEEIDGRQLGDLSRGNTRTKSNNMLPRCCPDFAFCPSMTFPLPFPPRGKIARRRPRILN